MRETRPGRVKEQGRKEKKKRGRVEQWVGLSGLVGME